MRSSRFPAVSFETIPAILVAIAIIQRKRLDSARWLVAIFTFLNGLIYWIENATDQGVRFTHWTLPAKIEAPLFSAERQQRSACRRYLRTLHVRLHCVRGDPLHD